MVTHMAPCRPTRYNERKENKHSIYVWGIREARSATRGQKVPVALIGGHVTGIIVFGTSILFVCACKSGNSLHHALEPRWWQGQSGMIGQHLLMFKSTVRLDPQI
jgi:hypothetical protein